MAPPDIAGLVEAELGPTSWIDVAQDRIDAFAAATLDPQWIHVDPDRAAAGPFGTTVAHGFLVLALLVPMLGEALPTGDAVVVNYGLDRVRFTAPVPAGSRVRGRFRVTDVAERPSGTRVAATATVEREGGDGPVCVADLIVLIVT
jgi:acyl dehydratase